MEIIQLTPECENKSGYVIECQTIEDYSDGDKSFYKFKWGENYFYECEKSATNLFKLNQLLADRYNYQNENCNYYEVVVNITYKN